MKQTFRFSLAGLLTTFVISTASLAQDAVSKLSTPAQETSPAITSSLKAADMRPGYLNDISIRAVRDFEKQYKNVSEVKWFVVDEGFIVYCNEGDNRLKVFYGPKGNFKCTVRNYTEAFLPKDVRHLVKSNYYDFNIFYVTEISSAEQKVYIIKLESKTAWNDVKVVDGEIVSVKEYVKS
jgi:DNA-dependent RNA polymerase auxiliary subunit epsilon